MGITQTQLAVSADELAGGTEARIRVLASDGINTSDDVSDAVFTVTAKYPSVWIVSPVNNTAIAPGSLLWLKGSGYDLEDGTLGEEALAWSSDREGPLGAGTVLLVTLSPGQHLITLEATDSNGGTATASVGVFVGYKTYLPTLLRQSESLGQE